MFAIPELVIDGKTGMLLEAPPTAAGIAAAIESLLLDRSRYASMRKAARDYSTERFRWDRVGTVMCDYVERTLTSRSRVLRVAYVHVLPLEYYPPATNALEVFARQPGWTVRACVESQRAPHG